MANFSFSTGLLHLVIFFVLEQYSIAQTASDEPDRILKKRGDDAWFLEKSAWAPMPYDFGYEVRDLEGNEQYRNEQSDGNRVTGSYGFFGPDGIYRHVDYTADEREPGVAAQNPANVKIITEPLLPQQIPVPGGRILRPVEIPGVFDSRIIGDPVLEKGLTYIPGNGRGGSSGSSNGAGSGGSSDGGSDSGDDVPPIRRPTSSIRGGVGTSNIGGPRTPSGTGSSGAGIGNTGSGTGRPTYTARESIAAGRDPTIVTRDPTAFAVGIDDILGIGGRGITIPIGDRPKAVIPVHSSQSMDKTREDSPIIVVGSRTRGSSPSSGGSSSRNAGIDELLRSRELLERERELAAREQSLLERERNANRHQSSGGGGGVKGGSSYRQMAIPAHEFKRRDSSSSSSTKQQDSAMSDASTIDNKEPGDSELVKKNGSASSESSSVNSSKEDNGGGGGSTSGTINTNSKENDRDSSLHASVNAIETMLMQNAKNGKKGPIKVYISDGPMKGSTASVVMSGNSATMGNERERESSLTSTNTNGGMKENSDEEQTRKSFESTDQQISHLKFDDEGDKIARYRLKPTYRYPVDYQNGSGDDASTSNAIQIKRSYPKNYQQYRLLRSRLPRERPSTRSSRVSNSGSTKELASSSTKQDDKTSSSSIINDSNVQKHTATRESMGRLRMNRILSSKIISLKDNEQIASTRTTNAKSTDQRINFRNELLPRVNIAYSGNLIKRNGLQQPTTTTANELTEQSNNSQMYIQRYTNQTVSSPMKTTNSTSNLKHLNDAVLLTNVRESRDEESSKSNNISLPAILQSTLLSSDASSVQETTQTFDRPPSLINSTTIQTNMSSSEEFLLDD